jgi:hypothetical protein
MQLHLSFFYVMPCNRSTRKLLPTKAPPGLAKLTESGNTTLACQHGEYMEKNIRSKVLAIGRPLRVELQLDGEWLDRLRKLLQEMGEEGGAYPLHRYIEELLEADIVYRESHHTRRRGPFVQREAIIRWLREQRNIGNSRTSAASKH